MATKTKKSPPCRGNYVDFNGSPALYALRGECDKCTVSKCGVTRYLGKGKFRCATCDARADLKRYGATYSVGPAAAAALLKELNSKPAPDPNYGAPWA